MWYQHWSIADRKHVAAWLTIPTGGLRNSRNPAGGAARLSVRNALKHADVADA